MPQTPVPLQVGDMASWHGAADPPLHMDITAAAAPSLVLCCAHRAVQKGQQLLFIVAAATGAAATAAAAAQTAASGTLLNSRVVTLIVPHDFSWEAAANGSGTAATMGERSAGAAAGEHGKQLLQYAASVL